MSKLKEGMTLFFKGDDSEPSGTYIVINPFCVVDGNPWATKQRHWASDAITAHPINFHTARHLWIAPWDKDWPCFSNGMVKEGSGL